MRKVILFACILLFTGPMLFAAGQEETARTAEPITLHIVSHRVHKLVATEGAGGDVVAPFIQSHPQVKEVVWTILEIAPIHERLFREASLPSTEVAVGYVLDSYATPRIANLLEPLDEWQRRAPIEGFEDNFGEGMLDAFSVSGTLYGIPMRAASHSLGWNKAIFAERGLGAAPRTPEEFVDFAAKTTYRRADGVQVVGLLAQSHYYTSGVNSLARMRDGDYIKPGLKVAVTDDAVVQAFDIYREFYEKGYLPRNIPALQHVEKQRMAEEGQGAMTFDVMGKIYSAFRKPENKYADWDVAPYPLAKEIQAKYKFGPAQTAIWSFSIPKNARHKEVAWDFIRHLSSAESSLKMALNGNGPVRASVFAEQEFKQKLPYAELALQQALEARPMFPGFAKVNEAELLVNEYIELIMLGRMSARAGAAELAPKLRALSDELQ